MKRKNRLYFKKRLPEPKDMEEIEQKAFEQFSKSNYKRWHIPLVDNVLNIIEKPPLTILDVGCGPGILLKELTKRFPKTKIYGIDIESSALKLAKKNNNGVILKKAKVEKLPFKDNFFDVVISKDSFHEYSNPKIALREMYRVTTQKGIVYVQDLRRDLPKYLLDRVSPPKTVFEKLAYYSARASYTKREVEKMLSDLKIRKYKISTRNITKQMQRKYDKIGIEKNSLKDSFQSRFTLIIKKG